MLWQMCLNEWAELQGELKVSRWLKINVKTSRTRSYSWLRVCTLVAFENLRSPGKHPASAGMKAHFACRAAGDNFDLLRHSRCSFISSASELWAVTAHSGGFYDAPWFVIVSKPEGNARGFGNVDPIQPAYQKTAPLQQSLKAEGCLVKSQSASQVGQEMWIETKRGRCWVIWHPASLTLCLHKTQIAAVINE